MSETPAITEEESIRRLPGGLNVCTFCFARGWPKPHRFDFCIWKNGTEMSTVAGREEQVRRARLAAEHDRVYKAQRETIARLERERDEARGVRDHYIQQYARAIDLLKEADAARADAARMRLALEDVGEWMEVGSMADDIISAALTPDDGWLARKLAEAVEPYREALRMEVTGGVAFRRCPRCAADIQVEPHEQGCVVAFAFGGTPGGDE